MNDYYPWPTVSFRAMGSDFGLWLAADSSRTEQAFSKAICLIDELEHRMSRFLPNSELNQLNRSCGQPVAVSLVLYTVIERAVTMARQTDGLFDPTLLTDIIHVGYDRDISEVKTHWDDLPGIPLHRYERQWETITFDPDALTITLPAGVGIDLGGIGKGYTAQIVADFLAEVGPCLVDAGGDLVAGAAPDGYKGWPVTISAPRHGEGSPSEDILGIWLHNAALTTSGVDRRRWVRNGHAYHHLLDPMTGQPATSGLLAVSISTNDGTTAEALATAAMIGGIEAGSRLIESASAGGLFVTDQGCYALAGTLQHDGLWQVPVIGRFENGVIYYES